MSEQAPKKPLCMACRRPLPAPKGKGRPRVYCDETCKQFTLAVGQAIALAGFVALRNEADGVGDVKPTDVAMALVRELGPAGQRRAAARLALGTKPKTKPTPAKSKKV